MDQVVVKARTHRLDHRSRTYFDGCHSVAASLEQHAHAAGGHALAQSTHHTTGDENVLHGGVWRCVAIFGASAQWGQVKNGVATLGGVQR